MLSTIGSAMADEYNRDSYNGYGYGSAASVLSLGLKAGLVGAKVSSTDHTENAYYPGYIAGEARKIVAEVK